MFLNTLKRFTLTGLKIFRTGVSRQLWWGHRIPAYYCDSCGKIEVAREMPDVCPDCGSTSFTQDEDTLDTWFSSALWPFSTLGWPEETKDYKYFYPTDVLLQDMILFSSGLYVWYSRAMSIQVRHHLIRY